MGVEEDREGPRPRRGTETHSERGYRLPASGGHRNSEKGALDRDRSIKIQNHGVEGEGDTEIKISQLRQNQNCRQNQTEPETQARQSRGAQGLGRGAAPRRLRQKVVTVAEPVTAPGSAGFSLWVCTANLRPVGPGGPLSSTSTTCMSVRLGQAGWSVWLARPQPEPPHAFAHLRSATSTPTTRSKPRLGAASAAAAMVLELRGAKGQSPRTGPS